MLYSLDNGLYMVPNPGGNPMKLADVAPPESWYVIVVSLLSIGSFDTQISWLVDVAGDVRVNPSSGNTVISPE